MAASLDFRPFGPSNRHEAGQIGRILAVVLVALAAGPRPASGQPPQDQVRLAPYVATPPDVVERMLRMAGVDARDVVYDLGCGDGRIVIAAAKQFGARGVGIDLDPNLIRSAREAAAREGVSERVEFRVGNVLEADVSEASVVALYLGAASNVRLKPQLIRQLVRGARIVAHNFGMGDWEPDAVETFRDGAGATRTIYLWTIDARVKP